MPILQKLLLALNHPSFKVNITINNYVEKFIERIELELLIEKSQMTDKEAWKLSEEIKEEWWKKNKDKVLKRIKK